MNAFDVPFAQVSLVDRDWVHTPGSLLHAPGGQAMAAGLPRDQSPAAWVVAEGRPFVVEDASRDPRFAQNPALRAHGVRFYAGVPLRILDTQARELRDGELETLADMAAQLAKDLQAAQAKAKPQVDRTAGDS
jgi:GAF domain-containing protein